MSAGPARVTTHALQDGQVEELKKESVHLFRPDHTEIEGPDLIWIDVVNPGEAEATYLRDQLGLHPLAVEDSLRGRQRPKIDAYDHYSFMVFFAARVNHSRSRMALHEVHLFLAPHAIITVHQHDIPEISETLALWKVGPARWQDGPSLAHALIDRMVDNYFPLVEHFSDKIEGFEEQVFLEMPDVSMQRVIEMRRELVYFRRILGPERDVLSNLLRRELPVMKPELVPYYQDIHDHILRVAEEMDTLRELLAGLLEIQASNVGRQLNQTMRTLTAWSIILMTTTLVAGIYGMNFIHMPELAWRYGYLGAIVVMLVAGLILFRYFHRRRWL